MSEERVVTSSADQYEFRANGKRYWVNVEADGRLRVHAWPAKGFRVSRHRDKDFAQLRIDSVTFTPGGKR